MDTKIKTFYWRIEMSEKELDDHVNEFIREEVHQALKHEVALSEGYIVLSLLYVPKPSETQRQGEGDNERSDLVVRVVGTRSGCLGVLCGPQQGCESGEAQDWDKGGALFLTCKSRRNPAQSLEELWADLFLDLCKHWCYAMNSCFATETLHRGLPDEKVAIVADWRGWGHSALFVVCSFWPGLIEIIGKELDSKD